MGLCEDSYTLSIVYSVFCILLYTELCFHDADVVLLYVLLRFFIQVLVSIVVPLTIPDYQSGNSPLNSPAQIDLKSSEFNRYTRKLCTRSFMYQLFSTRVT